MNKQIEHNASVQQFLCNGNNFRAPFMMQDLHGSSSTGKAKFKRGVLNFLAMYWSDKIIGLSMKYSRPEPDSCK
jgi:hypothetical protein